MAVTRVQITRRTQTELGQDGINQLCRNLFAIDCQTCGTPLDVPRPAVTVDDYGTFAHAALHHPACRPPCWQERNMPVENPDEKPTLSFRTFHVMQLNRGRDGTLSRTPTILLNPSLEAVILDRQPDGSWLIDTPQRWAELGFVRTGAREIELPDIPAATATLATAVDGGEPVMTITVAGALQWSLSLVHAAANAVTERGGVALVLLSDTNPAEFTTATLDQETFSQLLASGTAAAGWIPLVPGPAISGLASEHAPAPGADALPSKDPAHPH